MNLRLVIADNWPNIKYEDPDDIDQFVLDNRNDLCSLETVGLLVEDFILPDNISNEHIGNICTGKVHWHIFHNRLDFYHDYYNWWIFIQENNNYKNISWSKNS